MTELDRKIKELKDFLKQKTDQGTANYLGKEIREICGIVESEQLLIHGVGWRSEQLPEFDVQEINEILQDCKEKKEDLQALVCRIWNKGYMTAVADEREG